MLLEHLKNLHKENNQLKVQYLLISERQSMLFLSVFQNASYESIADLTPQTFLSTIALLVKSVLYVIIDMDFQLFYSKKA